MADLGIYRKLGSELIFQGKMFLNKATPVQKTVHSFLTVINNVMSKTGLPVGRVTSADENHYTTDIETWKMIIENDWVNKKQWLKDYFDCDNFAGSFTSMCADIYGLNGAGRISVELKDPVSGKHLGYHRAVLIVTASLDCWLYEPMTDELKIIEVGKFPVLGEWEYCFGSFDIN